MPITKGFRALVDEAMAQVTTYNVDQVRQRLDDPALQLVDIRDARELEREGPVPGLRCAGGLSGAVHNAQPLRRNSRSSSTSRSGSAWCRATGCTLANTVRPISARPLQAKASA